MMFRVSQLFLAISLCMISTVVPGQQKPGPDNPTGPRNGHWKPAVDSGERVIYGDDDRIDLYEEMDPARRQVARAVCALIPTSDLMPTSYGTVLIRPYPYTFHDLPPCEGEAFATQPVAAYCSGFLVGPDLIATAGHCYYPATASSVSFVFGFAMEDPETPVLEVPESHVYTAIDIVSRDLNLINDFAILRTDRVVDIPGVLPLSVRREGVVPVNAQIGVVGYPWGLPLKLAFGNNTRVSDTVPSGYFTANLDSYGGNSGSPVFNAATLVVEGILVRGRPDYITTDECFYSSVLPNSESSEESTKTTLFADILPDMDWRFSFEKQAYRCGEPIAVRAYTATPATPVTIMVESRIGDSEAIMLTDSIGEFVLERELDIVIDASVAVPGDGVIQAGPADTLAATYGDIQTMATIDCAPPVVEVPHIEELWPESVTIAFSTSEESSARLLIGDSCGDIQQQVVSGSKRKHQMQVIGLEPDRVYHWRLEVTDRAGNRGVFPEADRPCLSFRTPGYGAGGIVDSFEPLPLEGWESQTAIGTDSWRLTSATLALSAPNTFAIMPESASKQDVYLVSPEFEALDFLQYYHTYSFEFPYDGAVLEISDDEHWVDLGPYILVGGYAESISRLYGNPIAGRKAWTGGRLGPMNLVRVDLRSFPGPRRIRFRAAFDTNELSDGWLIDDVRAFSVDQIDAEATGNLWITE